MSVFEDREHALLAVASLSAYTAESSVYMANEVSCLTSGRR